LRQKPSPDHPPEPADNVVIALADLPAGELVAALAVTLPAVPRGHKIATRAMAAGERVIRYGQIIGQATVDIPPGAHVHSHNLGMGAHSGRLRHWPRLPPAACRCPPADFRAITAPMAAVGTRNYLGILTSVNCSASVARFIAEAASAPGAGRPARHRRHRAIVHQTGCGMSGGTKAMPP
jgi:altronate dehydratase